MANNDLAACSALCELIDKICPGLDTGDMIEDARTASAALDRILKEQVQAKCGPCMSGQTCGFVVSDTGRACE